MDDKKYVYFFDEGNKSMKPLLGGKGANLSEMTRLGVPVPPGFTITTEACDYFYKNNKKLPKEVLDQTQTNLERLEKEMGKTLGDEEDPLLVSVRSGAAQSMPGMMDTVLNLGLNDKTVEGLAKKTDNSRFAWDAYRRFIQMFGNVVMGMDGEKFGKALDDFKKSKKVENDVDLKTEDLKELVDVFKKLVDDEKGESFPQDTRQQLDKAILAVFGSWNNERAILYRRLNSITGLLGTAVNVQSMVFGNMGDTSGTGVAFSRNPSTGDPKLYGEFLMNAQGEDVVAGVRTPLDIKELKDEMPDTYKEFTKIVDKLEEHYKDMQDMEFTIQEGRLFFLQTRNGKRTAQAAVKIAVDMEKEGIIDKNEAVLRVEPKSLDQLLHKQLDPKAKDSAQVLAKGLPASPGAAVGEIVFDAHKAHDLAQEGKNVVLVRLETSPEDLIGMNAAKGILTSRGGMTSHAAVVARGMGKCCVAGCSDLKIFEKDGYITVGSEKLKEGDMISLDGSTGEVYKGALDVVDPEMSGNFAKIMSWADKVRTMKVRTNADSPKDAEKALEFGAEGIGLCRTEHMFFEEERIGAVREMILSEDEEGRRKSLKKILPYQREDFEGIFNAMDGKPVTIRLLDPPLHEFLPQDEEQIRTIAKNMEVSVKKLKQKIESLHETNPMLGHRGCRLAVTYPEITEMQVRAIMEAAIKTKAVPEIMIPLVGFVEEYRHLRDIVEATIEQVFSDTGKKIEYKIGTMIEVPRGALSAYKIAQEAEFFSFGTNDLTQMTLGFSRDDVGSFMQHYIEKGIITDDPFAVLDQKGVGKLVRGAVQRGKDANSDLKCGICGEHGGEPSSVEFCHRQGLDYVSCSPFRVPIARLAAAHAALKEKR
ncbi:MAG: pyruvate, phosphate dikinase [Candidatus Woesearchaeota archaeon]